MKTLLPIGLLTLSLALVACSSDEDPQGDQPADTSSSSGGGNDQTSSSGGNDQTSSSGGNDQTSSSGGSSSGGTEEPTEMCTAARGEALQEQTTVSGGQVKLVSGALTDAEGALVWVQAHAGGTTAAASQPRVYVKFSTLSKVEVSDVDAQASTGWDVALKRTNVFTNSGVGGPGAGGGQKLEKPFADITAADATAIAEEAFFDEDCELVDYAYPEFNGQGDGFTFNSTLSGWISYGLQGHGVGAKPDVAYIVRAADGELFKLKIESYSANEDGTPGQTSGNFLLRVAKL